MTVLTVIKARHRDHWVLAPTGELDVPARPKMRGELNELLVEEDGHVIIDSTGLRFCGVVGLHLFVQAP
ncbi:STAS domain-containing protein [Nonomuraea endophytica]|uniref:STAS domain-containing protein n=1 Tax=Nonomuraea endophytica TaxID=714136 RepID=UPI0037CC1B72